MKKISILFSFIVILFSCNTGDIDLGLNEESEPDFRDEFIGYWSFNGEGYDLVESDFGESVNSYSINNYQGRISKYDDDIYYYGGYFIKIEYYTNKSVVFRVTEDGDLLSSNNQTVLGSINSSVIEVSWMSSSYGLNGGFSESQVELTGTRN